MTEDDLIDSDGDINETEHSKLLAAVTQLEGKHRVKPSTRKEPTTQISEFHLVKSGSTDQDAVRIHELAQVLEKHTSHNAIAQKIRATKRHGKTLSKPLEKPEANRIDRTVRYENVKRQLSRWDAVVHANRLSDKLSFPLDQPRDRLQSSTEFLQKFKPQTPLEIEIAEILAEGKPKSNDNDKEDESEYPLTLEEMMERREELMQLRAKQWNRESRAARQKKIKSKKYHRILRREKIKEQLKEFEALQKTDPEAALERLEQLDKTRAEERASLRHRSTGHWARNRAVRAKYDKDSRQVLAQQLSISRELTQKVRKEDSSDDEEDVETTQATVQSSEDNPWVDSGVTASGEITNFVSGYRKYWQDKLTEKSKKGKNISINDADIMHVDSAESNDERDEMVGKQNEEIEDNVNADESSKEDLSDENFGITKQIDDFQVDSNREDQNSQQGKSEATLSVKLDSKKKRRTSEKQSTGNKKIKKVIPNKSKSAAVATTSGWIVESIEQNEKTSKQKHADSENRIKKKKVKKEKQSSQKETKKKGLAYLSVDELFDDIDAKLQNKLNKKTKKTKNKTSVDVNNVHKKREKNNSDPSLACKKSASYPVIDEEVSERERPSINSSVTKKKRMAPVDVDELFDDIDAKFQNKLNKKMKSLKQKLHVDNSDNVPEKSVGNDSESPLAFKKSVSRPVIDEELNEGINAVPLATRHSSTATSVRSLGAANSGKSNVSNGKTVAPDIDPNRFLTIKPKHLKTQLPDLSTAGDEALDDDEENLITITEAFAEDDVVGDFRKEKDELVNATKEKDLGLSMPGWGQWGGKDLPTKPRKKRRMIFKKPLEPPRKDVNKGDVIINEKKDDKIKTHLVNELPFPFSSVKSFEASIRAPIGNTWVPATSFWQLTNPEVETKLGAVIEPMDESHLINFKNKNKLNTVGSLSKYVKL